MTITMYGADWCGDCRRAKAWFDDNEISYDYIDLVDDPDATEVVLERNNGLKRIPVIVFGDDTHLTEPSNEALAAKMAELQGDATEPSFEVVDLSDEGRFELRRDGIAVGLATYSRRDGSVIVPHVETFPEHRGQGYAARLVDGIVEQVRAADETLVPLCPFAAQHVRDTPAHHDVLA